MGCNDILNPFLQVPIGAEGCWLVARAYNSQAHIPSFKWKLVLAPISPAFCLAALPASPSLELSPQRYVGYYTPNNRLKVPSYFTEFILILFYRIISCL